MIDTQAIRTKILDLAMYGKLTDHFPEDGTAEELYQRIQAEKKELLRVGKIKKEKPLPAIVDKDMPFDLPDNWRWVRLQDITSNLTLNDGDWVLSDDMDENGEVKLIQLGSIGDLQYRNKGFKHLTRQRFEELNGKQIYPGYLLINRLVADKMLLCILPEIEGVLITAVDVCWVAPQNKNYNIQFLMYALASSSVQQKVKEVGYGVTRFRISKTNLIGIPFPFPPLAEQQRIVEKIEQAFSVLDTIDSLQARYADNLTALKSKLIDAAIQGKLTEQLPEDGTAEELYQQIQAEKQALIKAGKIKKEKPLPEITADEIPFEIPSNWKWVRIGALFTLQSGKNMPANEIHDCSDETHLIPCYGGNGQRGFVNQANVDGYHAIVGRQGALCGNINFATGPFYATEHAVVVYEYAGTDMNWAGITLRALNLNQYATSVAQPGLAVNKIDRVLIPLPPLAEQKRIVERLNEVMSCFNS